MKKRMLVLPIITVSILGSATAYLLQPSPLADQKAEPIVSQQVVEPVQEIKEVKQVEVAEPKVVEPVQVAPVVVEELPAPVRSINEILVDYHNLYGDKFLRTCMDLILQEMPEKFTEDVREVNIKLLSDRFVSSCSACWPVTTSKSLPYLRDTGQGDFWERFGQ